jgi:hypothetical protein
MQFIALNQDEPTVDDDYPIICSMMSDAWPMAIRQQHTF